jgi:radical SAM superfamily enzyme YgiQ (UPF0313 family)
MARLLFLQNQDCEVLGPMYISAVLKRAGHDCRLAIGNRLKHFAPVITEYRPDLVAFSVLTGSQAWATGMAAQTKAMYGIRSIFGGPHVTYFPAFAADPAVDIAVRGEGEAATLEVMDRIAANRELDGVANVCFRRNGALIEHPLRPLEEDLDQLPFPDRDLYRDRKRAPDRDVYSVLSARGCPYSCTFCFTDSMRRLYKGKGKGVRTRRVDQVIAECRELKEQRGALIIHFPDDLFGVDRRWLKEFLPRFKEEIGLPFSCNVRADIVSSDPLYARRLAEAGCRMVHFGIESGNEQLRNKVLNKRLRDDQIFTTAEMLHAAGIRFRTCNMMGLPDETLVDALATLEMNIKVKADYPGCYLYQPYPGTSLAEYACEKGYVDGLSDGTVYPPSQYAASRLKLPQIREIENLQKFFQTGVLWPRTLPLIKRLVRLPPNPLFTTWFGLVYFVVYLQAENRRFWKTIAFAIANARQIFG